MHLRSLFPTQNSELSETIRAKLRDDFIRVDQIMLRLLVGHWLVVSTASAMAYDMYLLGVLGGGGTCAIAWAAVRYFKGTVISRTVIGISLMIFSAIMIQQHLGRIEMHFHVFVALSFLMMYRDISPVWAAALTIALHHLIFNFFQVYDIQLFNVPLMVFNYGEGIGIVFLHTIFVVAQAIFLSYIIITQALQRINDLIISETIRQVISEKDMTLTISTGTSDGELINRFLSTLRDILKEVGTQSDRVSRNIQTLTDTKGILSEGSSKTHSIAGDVVNETNKLAQEMGEMRNTITLSAEHIKKICHAISGLSESLSSIHSATESSQSVVNTVASSADQIRSTLSSSGDNMNLMIDNVQTVADTVVEVEESLREVHSYSDSANKESQQANTLIQEVIPVMDRLVTSAREINAVVNSIKHIAERTNMLALNASIEAAGAGEAGKGFAVVANEVKELAQQTTKATQNISSQVTRIQNNINESSVAIESFGELVEKLGHVNRAIIESVDAQSAQMSSLAQAMQTVTSSTEVVSESFKQLDAVAANLSETSEEAARSSSEVYGAVVHATELSGDVKNKGNKTKLLSESALAAIERTDLNAVTVNKKMEDLFHLIRETVRAISSLDNLVESLNTSGESLAKTRSTFKN